MTWYGTQASGTVIDYNEWNNMVDHIYMSPASISGNVRNLLDSYIASTTAIAKFPGSSNIQGKFLHSGVTLNAISANRLWAGTGYISAQTGIYANFISANNSNLTTGGGSATLAGDMVGNISGASYTYGFQDIDFISSQAISGGTFIGGLHYPADYVVYKDNSTCYAKKASNGVIYSNVDASNVIQYAVDNIDSIGGTIYITPEDYTLTTTIKMSGGIIIKGGGMDATEFTLSDGITGFLISSVTQPTYGGGISDVVFDGGAYDSCVAIKIYNVWKSFIHNTRFTNYFDNCIETHGSAYECDINNCRFQSWSGNAIVASSNGTYINNCDFGGGNQAIGIYAYKNGTKITNNWFEFGAGKGGKHIYLDGADSTLIDNNIIGTTRVSNSGNHGIFIKQSDGTLINNNEIGGAKGSAIYISGDCSETIISNNEFTSWHIYAIYGDGLGSDTIIDSNNFNYTSTYMPSGYIYGSDSSYKFSVTNNFFYHSNQFTGFAAYRVVNFNNNRCYRIGGAYAIQANNNYIDQHKSHASGLRAQYAVGNFINSGNIGIYHYTVCNSNYIIKTSKYGLLNSVYPSSVVDGNYIWGCKTAISHTANAPKGIITNNQILNCGSTIVDSTGLAIIRNNNGYPDSVFDFISSQAISGQLLALHKARDITGWNSASFTNSGLIWQTDHWEAMPSGGSGGGASTFISLTDSPSSYDGNTAKLPMVNVDEDELIFVDITVQNVEGTMEVVFTDTGVVFA